MTVVIPTYDDFDQLTRAIERARRQTWPGLDIIVVDDRSTEPVAPRLSDVVAADGRLRVVRRDTNGGVFEAQQTGLAMARGEYVYLGSTNDPIEPNFVATNLDWLRRYPFAGMSFSDPGVIIGWDDAGRGGFPLCLSAQPVGLRPDEIAERMRAMPFHISSNTVLFRTDALRRIGGCRTALGLYADWFACVVTALREGAVYIPEVLAFSRTHPGAYSERGRWSRRERIAQAAATLQVIAAEAPDVVPRLRRSRVVSSFGLPVLAGLLRDATCRAVITPGALAAALLRDGWGLVRAVLPAGGRRFMRRMMSSARA